MFTPEPESGLNPVILPPLDLHLIQIPSFHLHYHSVVSESRSNFGYPASRCSHMTVNTYICYKYAGKCDYYRYDYYSSDVW